MSILSEILESKKDSIRKERVYMNRELAPSKIDFAAALQRKIHPALIGELKRKSPSKGVIREEITPDFALKLYQPYASALSVLTEPNYFGGSLDDLGAMRELTELPLLRKDFITDPVQVIAARVFGAGAYLLIVAALSDTQLAELMQAGTELGMTPLVETHTPEEVERALKAEANLIGFNNRSLHDLSTDLSRSKEIASLIREVPGKKWISESGFYTKQDLEELPPEFDAVLVGTSIMSAENPQAALKAMFD